MDSRFRRSDGPTPKNHLKGTTTPRWHHPCPAVFSVIPIFPVIPIFSSFWRKPESTRCAGLRFSPKRQPHTASQYATEPPGAAPSSPSPAPPLRRPQPGNIPGSGRPPYLPAAATPPSGPSQSPIPPLPKIPAQMMTPAPCRPRNPPVIITDIRWERKSGSATAQRKVTVTS